MHSFLDVNHSLKKWFKNLLVKNNRQEDIIKESVEEIKDSNFREVIRIEGKERILFLQRKLKEKQLEIADLTDEELDEMIELYENQIKEKKDILRRYKKGNG